MKRPLGFMALQTFYRILAEIPPYQKILRLHHFGEAVLHPQIFLMIAETRKKGLIPVISVNPSTLTPEMNKKLIRSGVGIICFSLDSLKEEKLRKIRGVKRPISYVLRIIRHFIEERVVAPLLDAGLFHDEVARRWLLGFEGEASVGIDGDLYRNFEAHLLFGLFIEGFAELHDVDPALTQGGTYRRGRVRLAGRDHQLELFSYFLCHRLSLL